MEPHQLVRQIWQAVQITIGETKFEADVAALHISELPDALSKTCEIALQRLRRSGAQNTDHRHDRLLCVSHHRPSYRRTANERDEFAPPHRCPRIDDGTLTYG